MTRYFYKAKDWTGKLVKGVLDLPEKKEVIESIRQSGLVPLSINEENRGMLESFLRVVVGRAGLKRVATFTQQLSTMMSSGLPLTDALALLKNQTDHNEIMYEILEHALDTVQGGQSLGTALSKYEKVFGEAYIASVNAGEEGGVLEEVLTKLADSLEKESEFRGKVQGAMVYPVIVIIAMIIVAFIMMIFVIPKLMTLYEDFGSKMPPITQALMTTSKVFSKLWFLFPLLAVAIIVIIKTGVQNEKFRFKLDSYKLKIPVLGELNKKNIVANSLRTLAMLLSAGISLVDALKIVAKVADNELYYQSYMKIAERVQKGFSIANSFEEVGIFPPIVTQMVSTGEATGKLDQILLQVSDYFSREAEQSVKTLTAAIEPLIMVVLGIGVAFLVIAVIMPIYNLTSQF